ncbi:HalOD1 output domain-containing protein [Natrialbaceae archaeon GCM10025810]|uniref:HalOD1 output domain-containing protein n=1 Tax=Halovalidus salilacus TaxID=3075124 RepID=UPI00361563CD
MTTTPPTRSDTGRDGRPTTTAVHHDWGDGEELVGTVVSAVAEVAGKNETDVERLYDRLNPDSLNSLFRRSADGGPSSDALLVFSLDDCTVSVYGSGLVIVQGASEA